MPLSPGQVLNNRYRIVKLLGQGGFGAVYRAWDMNLDSPRALKENLDVTPESQRQFKQEAQILDKLVHPNLPRVLDHFIIPGQGQYFVMNFVEGEDLQQKLDIAGGPLPEALVLPWILQVCDALVYLHSQKPPIIHRDIKPANIKITPQGKAILVDFGIAKIFDPNLSTTKGARAVTSGYSPPEQYGRGATDARSDVYALGATCYTLFTGQVPPDSVDILTKRVEPPQSVRSVNPKVSPAVSAAITKAMQLDWENRFPRVTEFNTAINSLSSAPSHPKGQRATAPVVPGVTKTALRRLSWGWIGALGAFALIVVFSFTTVLAGIVKGLSTKDRLATQTAIAHALLTRDIPPSETSAHASAGSPSPLALSPIASLSPITLSPTPLVVTILVPTSLPNRITDEHGVEMALVSSGQFQMGSNLDTALVECQKLVQGDAQCKSSWWADEEPMHSIALDNFYIDIYEVTNARYAECVQSGNCQALSNFSSKTRASYYNDSRYGDYPVIFVDWFMAKAYCEWRMGRLPSEAEWEKAARSNDARLYPWGNIFDGHLTNFCDRSCEEKWANSDFNDNFSDTAPVGSYPEGVSPYGVYDLAGNVWEWVYDWYDAYPGANQSISSDFGNEYRVFRGGSWFNYGYVLRTALREYYKPTEAVNDLGFRCARSP